MKKHDMYWYSAAECREKHCYHRNRLQTWRKCTILHFQIYRKCANIHMVYTSSDIRKHHALQHRYIAFAIIQIFCSLCFFFKPESLPVFKVIRINKLYDFPICRKGNETPWPLVVAVASRYRSYTCTMWTVNIIININKALPDLLQIYYLLMIVDDWLKKNKKVVKNGKCLFTLYPSHLKT